MCSPSIPAVFIGNNDLPIIPLFYIVLECSIIRSILCHSISVLCVALPSTFHQLSIQCQSWQTVGSKKGFNLGLPQHKRAQISDKTQDALQVISAGLLKYRTTCLKVVLEILGFDLCYYMLVGLLKAGTQKASSDTSLTGALRPHKDLRFTDLVESYSHLSPENSKAR